MEGSKQNIWSPRTVRIPEKQTFFGLSAATLGTCENLINALKLLTNATVWLGQRSQVCWERSRSRIMDGHWKFISEDNHKAVKVGRLALGNNVKESDTAEVHVHRSGDQRRCG